MPTITFFKYLEMDGRKGSLPLAPSHSYIEA